MFPQRKQSGTTPPPAQVRLEEMEDTPTPAATKDKGRFFGGGKANQKVDATVFKRQIIITDDELQQGIEEADEAIDLLEAEAKEKEAAIRAVFEQTFLKKVVDDLDTTTVTDIGYNGTELRAQCNVRGRYITDYQPSKGEVHSLLLRIANIQGFEFTDSEPILDTEIGGVRLSANHQILSPTGDTFALRISRPRLALTDINDIAQPVVGDLLSTLVKANQNIIIAGVTGSGKTELQKYLVGSIQDDQIICLMEDTMDSHLKALYPKKAIYSWRTLSQENRQKKIYYRDLIKASLRNNPEWAIISETRGEDAYYVLQVALTGHSIMTTIHAEEVFAIPTRMLDMIAESRTINTDLVGNNIVRYLSIGVQTRSEITPGGIRRFIAEVAEYTGFENGQVVGNILYRVTKKHDPELNTYKYTYQLGKLSQRMIDKLTDAEVIHLLPDCFHPDKK